MSDFLKKNGQFTSVDKYADSDDFDEEEKKASVKTVAGFATTNSARVSTDQAAKKFAKPDSYDRKLYDSGSAKVRAKKNAFKDGQPVYDPYTGKELVMTKKEAKERFGDDWQNHLAEADHVTPLEKLYEKYKNNPWVTNDDIKTTGNDESNLKVTSRKVNNAKRSRTNEEFVSDKNYMKKTGVEMSKEGIENAKKDGHESKLKSEKSMQHDSVNNIIDTVHEAGTAAAKNAGVTTVTMSGIMNIVSVIKGEKTTEEALKDTAVDTGKAAISGYIMGSGLTTVSHTLSYSSSSFIKALAASNIPGQVITAVTLTGDTLRRYGNGEISTQECIIELGEKGLNFATAGYAMALGQALIPIPVVGGAIGALVGSMLTSGYYHELINTLKIKELEHQERMRIIAECEKAAEETRAYRIELEAYLKNYFREYRNCFDSALNQIDNSFRSGDVNGVINGANQITRKLGGTVYYETMEEFEEYLLDDSVDIL